MQLFNTMGRKKEEFTVRNNTVRMYVCGVTPYDTTHLGHARTYTFFDVVRRYLESLGNKVSYVQNITDIDDPLFERARQLGVPFESLVKRYVDIYFDDLKVLNIRPADVYPRVSQEMGSIVKVIDGLLSKGHGYSKEGRAYFRVMSFPDYGKLSQLDRKAMLELETEIGEDIFDPRKEDQLDFLLWKPSAADEPSWPSPWGNGRPGWHIECTTMSLDHLGESIDIHGGGKDLIFPHHENEIAQAEAFTGDKPFVRFWIHSGMVYRDGVKMSKSLGNMIFVRDLSKRFSGNAIRLYLLGTHYSEVLDYREPEIEAAARLANILSKAATLQPEGSQNNEKNISQSLTDFRAAMEDDFDTPKAIQIMEGMADSALNSAGTDKQENTQALRKAMDILGLDTSSP